MKVLYHHRTMADGAEGIHIREIVSALRSLGHEVVVVALAGDPTRPAPGHASRVTSLRRLIPAFGYEIAELGYNLVGYRRIMAAIGHVRPDIIYDRYNTYSTAAAHAARRAGVPLLLEVNAPGAYERTVDAHLRLKFPRLARNYERWILRRADRIFAVSTPLKDHLAHAVGIDAGKIVVLPNGADPDVFVPGVGGEEVRRRYGIEDRVVIGFVGILRPWHGVDLLLEAFRDLRRTCSSAHLLIVGDGSIQDQLEAHAAELGLGSSVTFTGRLAHQDVVAHVAAMDVTVSPQATFYASPMKVLEYMSMGKAVVAPAMDNIRDIIDDEESGLLFEPGSAVALASAIRRMIADEGLRRRLGEQARRRIVERLNWRQNARRIIEAAARSVVPDTDEEQRRPGTFRRIERPETQQQPVTRRKSRRE